MQIHYLVIMLLVVAFAAAFIFIITGKFLDLRAERVNVDMFRAMANMLNYLSTSSPILSNDAYGNIIKSIMNISRLESTTNIEWYSNDCCDINGFDYVYTVSKSDKSYNFSDVRIKNGINPAKYFPYFNQESHCYQLSNFLKVNSIDNAVKICDSNDNCEFGTSSLTMARTPLSEITYWLSRACTTGDQSFSKTILLDDEDVNHITLKTPVSGEGEVCMFLKNSPTICKKYSCDLGNVQATEEADIPNKKDLEPVLYRTSNLLFGSNCFSVRVRSDGDGNINFDNLKVSKITPSYTWNVPQPCISEKDPSNPIPGQDCPTLQPIADLNHYGDIAFSTKGTCFLRGYANPCWGNVGAWVPGIGGTDIDVKSDVVRYRPGNELDNLYLNGNVDDDWVSSAQICKQWGDRTYDGATLAGSTNCHGYIWESIGPDSNATECCLGDNCNSDVSSGNRMHSYGILNSNNIDTAGNKITVANNFNKAWCGAEDKQCLLCAPDKKEPQNTKWYVCSGGQSASRFDVDGSTYGSGIQETQVGDRIEAYYMDPNTFELKKVYNDYICTPEGWE